MIWPPIRYSYNTVNNELPMPAPSPPAFQLTREQACAKYPQGVNDPDCAFGNLNWLGTDDQGRDVVARLIYGFRISVLFGLTLTLFSSIVGIAAGATTRSHFVLSTTPRYCCNLLAQMWCRIGRPPVETR